MAKVFYIEDNPELRFVTTHILKSFGFQVEEFESAEGFLGSYELTPKSCLLLDVRLPGMSGLELIKQLAKNGDPTPVVLLTGYASHVRNEISTDKVCLLEKPIDPVELVSQIKYVMKMPT